MYFHLGRNILFVCGENIICVCMSYNSPVPALFDLTFCCRLSKMDARNKNVII